ncbi:DNA polymerase (family 10) [Abditibacterium utsteinense]|uniref:DNA polymerase (Family 10) n=1 Tax=Abditibacterium utsteinense TaxID=1960156 RepID=A0A2S8STX5_9BACT|nr:DNA polymerase/3'-5' exonuclease PolX [Abditibacterium utsteinense]PQV64255.1 DNA polymerase (family 10) [Abditibacterium utsteinense]
MQNAALARVFEELADYLELSGENPFKIRAYRTASEAILDFPAPIESAAENGTLDQIEGLGFATISKSKEFLATGRVRVLEELKLRFPPGLLEVLRVPGLGPKKVALLYQEKGVDSLPKFAELLENGELNGVSGFGAKTIENLKTNLRRLSELTARMPITQATVLAQKIQGELREKLPDVEIEIAGSLRRGCDTVGNLNFVAKSKDAAPVLEAFEALGIVTEITTREPNRIVGRAAPGIEVEISVAPPQSFGSMLFFRTGSEKHVQEIMPAVSGIREEHANENAFFAALGMSWIPPELRENRGEIEAAQNGKLPDLLTLKQIRGDLHTHSTWSDGVATIRQMALLARARGYEYYAITDHSKALAMANGLNAQRLRQQAEEIAEVQQEFPDLKLLRGIECDILRDGTMDLDDECLSQLDIVIGSVHSGFNLSLSEQTARMVRALENPHVDCIGHPTGRILGVRAPYDVDVLALIEAAAHFSKALEINASERLDLRDEHAFAAREADVLLCIDTDAHSPKMLENLGFGVQVARRAWCESKDILNAKPLNELLQWLSHKK